MANIPKERILGDPPGADQRAVCAADSIFSKDFIAFLKPFDATLSADDPNNFYMEREWRKYGNMRFKPTDVVRVLIGKRYESRIKTEFPEYKAKVIDL